ncbi:MAG: TerB family tellurite resistance protein [Mariprofundales bacterium]
MGLFGLFKKKKKHRSYKVDIQRSSHQRSQLVRSEASERAFVVLLVKMMNEDGHVDNEEYQQIIDSVMECVQMDSYSIRDLINDTLADDTLSLHKLLSDFMRSSTVEDRESLVLQLWQVAMSDGHIDEREEALLNKVSARLQVKVNV